MSNEYKDRMLQLLTQVDDVKAKDGALQLERKRHQDQIAQSEADLQRTEDDIGQCREDALSLRRQMDDLKNEIFHREDDEEPPVVDNSHIPTEDGSPEQERHRVWKDQERYLKSVR
jgi:chromosome segregation ATPase